MTSKKKQKASKKRLVKPYPIINEEPPIMWPEPVFYGGKAIDHEHGWIE